MSQVGNRDVQNSDPPQGLHGDLWCIFQLLESIPTILESNYLVNNNKKKIITIDKINFFDYF